MSASVTLVIGGARSGKSDIAEKLVLGAAKKPLYLATAQAHDHEMEQRIARHQKARASGGWTTKECPTDLTALLAASQGADAILIDCATLWLSNHMFAKSDLAKETARLMTGLKACKTPVVIVTNEVGQGIVPENALAREFRDAQGRLNQDLAALADKVILVVAGIPMPIKGELPADNL